MATSVLPNHGNSSGHLPQEPDTQQPNSLIKIDSGRRIMWLMVGLGSAALSVAIFFLIPNDSAQTGIEKAITHQIKRGNVIVSVIEQGTLESSENTEVKCRVRGQNTIIWVVEGGTKVKKGDVLVRLDTFAIEEAIDERTKFAHLTRSSAERLKGNLESAKLAIDEYLEGRFKTQLMTLEKELSVAKSNLRSADDWFRFSGLKKEKGFTGGMEMEEREIARLQAKHAVIAKQTEIEVLKNFTKAEQLETLKGNLKAAQASYNAESERAKADASRRDRAVEEYAFCVIKAPRDGLVIYPSAAQWKEAPDIEEGATVHKDQVLLLMPDLDRMQVKVGIHESIVEKVRPGLSATVSLPNETLEANVSSVAAVTRPAGWWTGNVVKYDTIIELKDGHGLKPGMSAEVEVILAKHEDVIKIPVSAVIETEKGTFCWVKTESGVKRRLLQLGDSNDIFIVVKDGVAEGDEVILNPLAHIDAAQKEVLKPSGNQNKEESSAEEGIGVKPTAKSTGKIGK